MIKVSERLTVTHNHKVVVGAFTVNSDVDVSMFTSLMDALCIRWGSNHRFDVSVNADTYQITWCPKIDLSPSEFEKLGCAIAAYILGFRDSQTNKWNN